MKRFLFLLAAIATVVALAPKASYAHRYFDAWAARWTTPDPALNENPQVLMKKYGYTLFETSPYMYTHDNPLRYADPNGKRGFDMIGGPMLPPTSWAQLKRNVIMAAAETGGAALLYYAPQAALTIASWWAENPAAANETANTVIDALAPAPGGVTGALPEGLNLPEGRSLGDISSMIIGPMHAVEGLVSEGYTTSAESKGAAYFFLSNYDELSQAARDKLNFGALDYAMKNGWDIDLTISKGQVREGTQLYKEVQYMEKNATDYGYRWNQSGTAFTRQ